MILDTQIIDSYLAGEDIDKFKNHWIYWNVGQGEFKGLNIFNKPSLENRRNIQMLYDENI